MSVVNILGWIALIITVVYTAGGLPVQVRKNIADRSTAGLSFFMVVLLFMTFCSWVAYAVARRDWYIGVANSVGAVSALIILIQFYLYRRRS